LLYKVGIYEIFLRNLLGYNGDFVEMFAQPYRIGKTMKTEESERAELAQALQDMGSSGWAIVDPSDTIEFLESALGGTGYQGYDNLEKRCQQYISKIILGHADALDSTSGKLGASQGEDNPIYQAIQDKQTRDGKYIENIINSQLIPKLRNLGFMIPDGVVFKYSNNAETEEKKDKAVKYAKQLSAVAVDLKNAGLGIDEQYFTEETGIPVYVNMQTMPSVPMNKLNDKTKAKLSKLYDIK
jgi:phage gp29-like protein